jgi:predicted phosphodiesterase
VHGNAPALEAVLAELEEVRPDVAVFGGDLAAGALPRETIALARSVPYARYVQGNADRELVRGEKSGPITGWPSTQLDDEDRAFLSSFELTVVLDDVCYCHATPRDDEPFVTVLTTDEVARETIGEVSQPTVVIGHTHSQFDRRLGDLRLVNAGSVGMPYEDRPGAYWALVRDGEPELRRTDYDLEAAAERIRPTGWPIAERWVEENLLAVPTARDAAEFFESQRAT